MLNINDIVNVSFRKAIFSGYRTEDVDHFIDEVRDSIEVLNQQILEKQEENRTLVSKNTKLINKIDLLNKSLDTYRAEEDDIKNALISAQKLGESSVREARHRAEIIIKDATLKADKTTKEADNRLAEKKQEFYNLQKEIAGFKSSLLNTYKNHLTLINALPFSVEQANADNIKEEVDRSKIEKIEQSNKEEEPTNHSILEYQSLSTKEPKVAQEPILVSESKVKAEERSIPTTPMHVTQEFFYQDFHKQS